MILKAFLRAQDPVFATALALDWEAELVQAEGRETRHEVRAMEQAIVDRISTSQVFSELVRSLHPWRQDQAVALRDTWPTAEAVVHATTSVNDLFALLRQLSPYPVRS